MKSDYLFFEGSVGTVDRTVAHIVRKKTPWPFTEHADAFAGFFASLLQRSGLCADHYCARAMTRRTAACLRKLGAATVEEGLQKIQNRPELADAALSTVLLGVTDFFRDRAVFDAVRFTVLPQLLEQHWRLRIWSAACSEGQELYSIAMLLAEEGRLKQCELIGTDCRRDAIRQAQSGVFSSETVARLARHWRQNFFTEGPISARLDPLLVQSAQWKTADLFRTVEPGPWHLILWRNMAIYLEPVAAENIWRRLYGELLPGGYVVAGKADHPPTGLPLTRVATCIYRKPVVAP